MTDDRFDRDLAGRLRAYESRLPDAPAPAPGLATRRRSGLPVLLAGGVAALAAVVLALVVLQGWGQERVGDPVTTPSPSGSAQASETSDPSASATAAPATPAATPSSAPSGSPTAEPTEPPPAATDLRWSTAGSFASDGDGPSMVEHVVAVDGGFVAAGVAYQAQPPNVGPTPPHTLTTWLSADGHAWEPVDSGLENVRFSSLVVRADGSLLATGTKGTIGEFGSVEGEEPAAWTSIDGRTWTETESGLPGFVLDLARGGQGYIALLRPDVATEAFELWHSPDAVTWTLAHTVTATSIDVGAGDEGFLAVGRTTGDPGEPFAIASGDGREWLTAASPPPALVALVAPRGGDWIALSGFDAEGNPANGETWVSANGLDWAPHGQAPMEAVEADGTECREYPRDLHPAGPWLVAATDLMYPCSEGGFAVHGTQLISTDGATFTRLPFEAGVPGQSRSGALINAAVPADDGRLILAGEMDGTATFWLGERP